MEDKDVEKFLKESAKEIKVKDFSERWNDISARISAQQDTVLKEPTTETVIATSENANISNNFARKKVIYSLCAVFLLIVLCLAIVLPITLKKDSEPIYFDLNELENTNVSENEFYNKLEESDLELVDIKKFDVNNYALLYTTEGKLVGGRFEIVYEVEGVYAVIVFYDKTVKSSLVIDADNKTCNINGFNIEYKTETTLDIYTTKVRAVNNSISYELECLGVDDNIISFFEQLFG